MIVMVDAITLERRARAAATTACKIRCAWRIDATHLDIFRNTNEHITESTLRFRRDPLAIFKIVRCEFREMGTPEASFFRIIIKIDTLFHRSE